MENNIAVNEKKQRPGLAVTTAVLAAGIAVVLGAAQLWVYVIEPKLNISLPGIVSLILRQMVIPYVVGLGLCLLLYRSLPSAGKQDTQDCRRFTAGDVIKGVLVQTGAGMVLAVIVNIISMVVFGIDPSTISSNNVINTIGFSSLYSVILLLIFAPAVEEFLFRKLVIDRLRRFGKIPAILISAVMFAFPHFFSQGAPACAMTLVLGLVCGYIYYRTNNLIPCMIIHMMFNLINGFLSYFLVSHGGVYMALYYVLYLLVMPVCAVIVLVSGRKKIFSRE